MFGNKKKMAIAMCVLLLALMAAPALAESGTASFGFGSTRGGTAPAAVTIAAAKVLTEEQKAAMTQAKADNAAAQAAHVENLVAGGILSQEAMDAKARVEAASETVKAIDTMQWTLEKNIVLRDALKKNSAEKAEILSGLVAEGLLTQEQADALYVYTTKASSANLDKLTVAQARQLRNTGNNLEYVALVQDFLAQELLSAVDADLLLAQRANTISVSDLTEEQKAALLSARTELSAQMQAIMEALRDAMYTSAEGVSQAVAEAQQEEQAPAESAQSQPAG